MCSICFTIALAAGSLDAAAPAPPVTYTQEVAPILWKNCAGCHRPGEVAPFSLLTYKDAAKRAEQLVEVTESRLMPPWKPDPEHGRFRDVRGLQARPRSRPDRGL